MNRELADIIKSFKGIEEKENEVPIQYKLFIF